MPNILDANGLQVRTYQETLDFYKAAFRRIYGEDVNLESNSPDGQMLGIITQDVVDLQDLLVAVNASFDPDQAFGVILDQRVAINGIQRQGGSYTVTNITLVNSKSINLYGLDQEFSADPQPVYTIADNAGNRWFLITSELGLTAGTHVLSFRAELPGAQLTTPNTITTPETIVLGVVSVNNPTTWSTLGENEETDVALKIRRAKSVALGSPGYVVALEAALQNLSGMASARVFENDGDIADADGIPAHSIWPIVSGSALPVDIANTIFKYRGAGAGMKGTESYIITKPGGGSSTMRWDNVFLQNLFIEMTINLVDPTTPTDVDTIRDQIAVLLKPDVYATMNVTSLGTIVQDIDSNVYFEEAGFSDGKDQDLRVSDFPASGSYKLVYNGVSTASLAWNASAGTVQTALRAIAGLENIVVSSTLSASKVMFLDLSDVPSVDGLIYAKDNTMQTAGAVAVTFSYDYHFANAITPTSKQNQFLVSTENTIVLQMQLLPATSTVSSAAQQQFTAYGGYGPYTYSISLNNSGGTIDATTGAYTAGPTDGVTDTIKVRDALGNEKTAAVTVV
jgi:hypothetical protein